MIVITAPTGSIGRQVVANLLARRAAVRVIARDASRLPADVRDRVDVVEGSHGDGAVCERAFAGATAVFWLPPPDPRAPDVRASYVDFTRPAVEAFRRQGVARVVGVSALGRGVPGDAGYVTASLAMDDLIAASGVAYRALVMPSFMDNLLRQVASIRTQGVFFGPVAGHRKAPTCATRDIAAAAVRLLVADTWTGVGETPVLGPEDLSFDDMATIMSDVLGTPVRFQQISLDAHKARLIERGMSDAMADGAVAMMAAKDRGLDNHQPRTAEGTTPTTFRQWCEEIMKPAVRS